MTPFFIYYLNSLFRAYSRKKVHTCEKGQKIVKKRVRKGKIYENLRKMNKIWNFFKKGQVIGPPAICWYISFLHFKTLSNLCQKHQQEIYVTLRGFWLLGMWQSLANALEKEKFETKSFPLIMLNEVLESCEKWHQLV